MPRVARIVVPEIAHHVVQRGNRRQDVFFNSRDYQKYLELMSEKLNEAGSDLIAYCLMTNHVHLVVIPKDESGLRPVGEAHRLYTRYVNFREGWRGYLWQGRFSSYPLSDKHLYEVIRYVELNPVRAALVSCPEDYKYSSAAFRLSEERHPLFSKLHKPNAMIDDWRAYWQEGLDKDFEKNLIEQHQINQNPLGNIPPLSGTQ